ncbi:uncharacterized protein [Clytia hemisphaerica]|uniref:XK-related protein n=1 Tax=Clytia hemisphaerica TaxID=252671 RepID=A0A7M5UR08_9CNID
MDDLGNSTNVEEAQPTSSNISIGLSKSASMKQLLIYDSSPGMEIHDNSKKNKEKHSFPAPLKKTTCQLDLEIQPFYHLPLDQSPNSESMITLFADASNLSKSYRDLPISNQNGKELDQHVDVSNLLDQPDTKCFEEPKQSSTLYSDKNNHHLDLGIHQYLPCHNIDLSPNSESMVTLLPKSLPDMSQCYQENLEIQHANSTPNLVDSEKKRIELPTSSLREFDSELSSIPSDLKENKNVKKSQRIQSSKHRYFKNNFKRVSTFTREFVNDSAMATQEMFKHVSKGIPDTPKYFTTGNAGIALALLSILLHMINMYTDVAVAFYYFKKNDYYFGSLTLIIVIVPSLIISVYTFAIHKKTNGIFLRDTPVSKPMVYGLCLILHGHVARCLMWLTVLYKKISLIGVSDGLWLFRDITSYAETFTYALPQLFLQTYIVVLYYGEFELIQAICIASSWLSAAWGIQSQFKGAKWKLLTFEMNLFWFASRAAAIALLASIDKSAPFIMLLGHFILVCPLWFWQNNIKPFRIKAKTSRLQLFITDAFYASIYGASNTVTPTVCRNQFWLSILLFTENIICIIAGRCYGKVDRTIGHFKRNCDYYSDALNSKNLEQSFFNDTKYCQHMPQFDDQIHCAVDFNQWIQSKITFWLSIGVAVFAFIQLLIVVILRRYKYISAEAMVSKLGTPTRLSSANGRINDSLSKTTAPVSSSSTRNRGSIPSSPPGNGGNLSGNPITKLRGSIPFLPENCGSLDENNPIHLV